MSCSTVFMSYLFCTLFMLHFSVLHSFHVAPFFFYTFSPVAHFSCCNFFMLHFFQFGPSLLTCFLFYSFHGALFNHCFSSHSALFTLHSFMSHSFHVAPFPCSTFLMLYSFRSTLSKSVEIAVILKLQFIIQIFQCVFKAVNLSRTSRAFF